MLIQSDQRNGWNQPAGLKPPEVLIVRDRKAEKPNEIRTSAITRLDARVTLPQSRNAMMNSQSF